MQIRKIWCFHRTSKNKSRSISIFRNFTCFFHSSLVKISHILKAMIFQFRVDMFLRLNNEKITSDFIMCVIIIQNTPIYKIQAKQMIFYFRFPDHSSSLTCGLRAKLSNFPRSPCNQKDKHLKDMNKPPYRDQRPSAQFLYSSWGLRAVGVPTNNQRGQSSRPSRLCRVSDKARHVVPTAL